MGRDIFYQTRLLRALSNLTLNASRDGASTASLGNLFHCFTTLTVQSLFLTSDMNLPSFHLKPLHLFLPLHALVKSPSPAFLQSPSRCLEGCYEVSPEPSLLQAQQPQPSHPVLGAPTLWSSLRPYSGFTPTGSCPSHTGVPNVMFAFMMARFCS